jgi:hypothetical protein
LSHRPPHCFAETCDSLSPKRIPHGTTRMEYPTMNRAARTDVPVPNQPQTYNRGWSYSFRQIGTKDDFWSRMKDHGRIRGEERQSTTSGATGSRARYSEELCESLSYRGGSSREWNHGNSTKCLHRDLRHGPGDFFVPVHFWFLDRTFCQRSTYTYIRFRKVKMS